jgi:iron only hydrogenase large subunit-like protein
LVNAGGYLEFIFRTAAQQLFHRQLPPGPLPMKTLRNADFTEISLDVEGRTVLRFAAAYGFRNIQTLVRKIKRRACEYDYVEVMACPSGCLNGGGQIKAHKGQTSQQLLEELDQHYHAAELVERHPSENAILPLVYKQFVGGRVYDAAARDCLHTRYHHREKSVSAMIGDW